MKFHQTLLWLLLPFGVLSQTITIGSGASLIIAGGTNQNTTLDCDGAVVIQAGGTFTLSGDAKLFVGGNFIKDGTTAIFNEGRGTITMDGTSAQVISGGTTPNATAYSIYNLTINNTSGVSIDASSNLTVLTILRALTPQAGTLTTNNKLRLNDRSTSPRFARLAYGTGNVSGNVIVEKRLNRTDANWRNISLPIALTTPLPGTNWNSFATNINVLLEGHLPANQINAKVWDASPANNLDPNGYAKGWRSAQVTDNQIKAFSIYLDPSNGLHTFGSGGNQEFSVTGELNQGNFSNNLFFTRDPASTNEVNAMGWNFIPNPWASMVDVNTMLNDGTNFTSAYKAIHVLDANTIGNGSAVYRAILANGQAKESWNTDGTDLSSVNMYLEPFQAFWVRATADAQVCNLVAQTMQIATAVSTPFMKKNFPTVRLNVFDQDSIWDQMVIYFDETLSRDFDLNGDAYYLTNQNSGIPVFYGIEQENKASIVGRPADVTDSIQVVFGSTKSQSKFYINADLDELEDGWHVYLRDKKDNKTYELNHNQSIAFNHYGGQNTERFVVYYSKQANAFAHLVTGQDARILPFVRNSQLVMQSFGVSGDAQINAFDAVGRLIFTHRITINPGEEQILDFPATQKLLFLEVNVGGKTFVEKVYY